MLHIVPRGAKTLNLPLATTAVAMLGYFLITFCLCPRTQYCHHKINVFMTGVEFFPKILFLISFITTLKRMGDRAPWVARQVN